jgi:hypothetical protein
MLYTPSHAELAQHPKTRKLARLLGCSIPTAIGHLHLLWHFALKYAPDGDISRFEAEEIADGCLWEGDPAPLFAAFLNAGWVNADATIHDWQDYGGKALKQKEDNAERQQRWRDRHKTVSKPSPNKPVTVTSPLYNALEEKRIEKSKEEERITPPSSPPTPLRPAAAPPDRPATDPPGFVAFWEAWPKKEGKAEALAKWRKLHPDADTIQAILDAIPRQQAAKDWPRENWRYCPLPATWLNQRRWEDEIPDPPPKGERELIGKDKERAEVMRRVLARRGYELPGTDATAHANGREVSHDPLRIGAGRVPR